MRANSSRSLPLLILHPNSGFTLAELLIAIIIVSVLAGMAYPRLTMQMERTKTAEAIHILEAILDAQRNYYNENNFTYAGDSSNLDITIPPSQSFDVPTVSVNDPLVSISRNNNAYSLHIDSTGTISCTPAGTTCTKLGY